MTVEFELDGQPFTALNGGPVFKFNEAISFQINCETQEEVDYYWDKLSAGGDPKAQQCGWLKDKYGVSWQVVPRALAEMLNDPDRAKSRAGDDGDAADEEARHRRAEARARWLELFRRPVAASDGRSDDQGHARDVLLFGAPQPTSACIPRRAASPRPGPPTFPSTATTSSRR